MFTVELFPARHGDAILLTYGKENATHRILIDGGVASTFTHLKARLSHVEPEDRHIELLVVTHVDADHIEGALKLLDDRRLGVSFGDVWFNGYKHLAPDPDLVLGAVQGEHLTARLEQLGTWNVAFDRGPVVVPSDGRLPQRTTPGGMSLTVLSPGWPQLVALRPHWEREVRRAGLVPGQARSEDEGRDGDGTEDELTLGDTDPNVAALVAKPFQPDTSLANGSSIALLAEYCGTHVLFTADAHAPVLVGTLDRLLVERRQEVLTVDAVKVSHHGSAGNTNVDLLRRLRCQRWLFSTDGSRFEHPDPEAVARIVRFGGSQPNLHFNYRTPYIEPWLSPGMQHRHSYSATTPDTEAGWVVLPLDTTSNALDGDCESAES